MKRTHNCNQLNKNNVNEVVVLCGWVHSRRDHGGLIFIDLRDREGLTQIVFNPKDDEAIHQQAHSLRSEYVICLKGKVGLRPKGTENRKLPTGEIEVIAEYLQILNTSQTLPFELTEDKEITEELRLIYRFLDLRRPQMQKNIILRHKIVKIMRAFLDKEEFIEIETPILTKSTPEGARDYLVPSRLNPGKFYALPQSPQLFKQILMVAGFDKYYQIAKCFRDEDLRKDRQPEFTQLDMEMSFIDESDIFNLAERMFVDIFEKALSIRLNTPFLKISYEQAKRRFGTDKPDFRFGMEIVDLTDIVSQSKFLVFAKAIQEKGKVMGINVNGGGKLSLKELDELIQTSTNAGAKGMVWVKIIDQNIQSPIKKHLSADIIKNLIEIFKAKNGDLILVIADQQELVQNILGQLRLCLRDKLGLKPDKEYEFVWVTDFPLFQYDVEAQRWQSEHHPFTAVNEQDINFLNGDLKKVRSRAYDLVINGIELGSGSIRIHKQALQEKIFKILGMEESETNAKFGFLLQAFRFGAPPHGGIAFGLDRLLAIITQSLSIRDVIAFPKTQKAVCPLTEAPSAVSSGQLKELYLTITE